MKLISDFIKEAPDIKLLFYAIAGSTAYGTKLPTSDTDYRGIYYIKNEVLAKEVPQLKFDKNDISLFELREFIKLLNTANPTVMELLFLPEDCIVYKDKCFDKLIQKRHIFLTKKCESSFAGYAKSQISKAFGQNKKQNWETNRITRKTPLDFCTVITANETITLDKWLIKNNYNQQYCGIAPIPHTLDKLKNFTISHTYDDQYWISLSASLSNQLLKLSTNNYEYCIHYGLWYGEDKGYNGIVKLNQNNEIVSNELRVSSIPKNEKMIGIFSYNNEAYSTHCKEYKEYQEWLKNRNINRWVDVQNHGQSIDGKNCMHLIRLLEMSKEIVEKKDIIIRRPNADYLIDIRKGKYNLREILDKAESQLEEIKQLYKTSDLPEHVDIELSNSILEEIKTLINNEKII